MPGAIRYSLGPFAGTGETGDEPVNWDQVKGQWKEMSGKAKQQWGKLTDDDVQEAGGQREELAGKIQQRYGKTKEEAEREVDEWVARH